MTIQLPVYNGLTVYVFFSYPLCKCVLQSSSVIRFVHFVFIYVICVFFYTNCILDYDKKDKFIAKNMCYVMLIMAWKINFGDNTLTCQLFQQITVN